MDKELVKYIDDDTVEIAMDFFDSGLNIDPADIRGFADSYKEILIFKNKWSDDLQARYDYLMKFSN